MAGVTDDYAEVIAELRRMQERLRTLRWKLCETATKENTRYHAFSGAVSHLNRVIADLEAE